MSEGTDRPEVSGGTGLSVLWLAEDELSYLGLPPMLRHVPAIARARVEQIRPDTIRLLTGEAFDVAVVPLFRCPDIPSTALPQPRTKVLVSLPDFEVQEIRSYLRRHTVCGFVARREVTVTGLSGIFERLARGEFPAPPALVRKLLTDRSGEPAANARGARRLTQREHVVLAQLVRGRSNHQIARAMEISVHGVKRHVSNLLLKFDCSNRTEVALAAARLGIDPSLRHSQE